MDLRLRARRRRTFTMTSDREAAECISDGLEAAAEIVSAFSGGVAAPSASMTRSWTTRLESMASALQKIQGAPYETIPLPARAAGTVLRLARALKQTSSVRDRSQLVSHAMAVISMFAPTPRPTRKT